MENKPQNVFDKLDHQGEQIDDISQKLEGVSIENLYALAERTWDYGDYQTAQKYYNHISLLNPLDWKAPLYASLCNYTGSHDIYYWENSLYNVSKIFVSTINYINNRDMPNDEKEKEMSRCIEIIKSYMLYRKDMYFKNIDIFNKSIPDYICKMESFFLTVYSQTKEINLDSLVPFRVFIANECLDLIQRTGKIDQSITIDIYTNLVQIADKEFNINFHGLTAKKVEPSQDLSLERKQEIMLKGKMYFEHSDKVISKRLFKRNLFIGLATIAISIAGFVVSFLSQWDWVFVFALPLIGGIVIVIKAFTEKNRILCTSFLCVNRRKNRLSSSGTIVTDKKTNILLLIIPLGAYIFSACWGINKAFDAFSKQTGFYILFTILFVIEAILSLIIWLFFLFDDNSTEGRILYYYQGKYYNFD